MGQLIVDVGQTAAILMIVAAILMHIKDRHS